MILRTRANVANKPIPAWNRHTLDLEEERERETCVCASESERKGKSFQRVVTTWFVSERQNFSKDVRFDWLSLKQFPRCALSFASCVHSLSLPSSLHSFRPYSLDDYAPLHNIIVYLALSTMKQRQRSALEFVSRSGDNGESIVRIMYQVNSLGFLPKS